MRHSNWIVIDTMNKRSDVIAHIKATVSKENLEERVLAIVGIKNINRNQVIEAWNKLPEEFKTHGKNLATA